MEMIKSNETELLSSNGTEECLNGCITHGGFCFDFCLMDLGEICTSYCGVDVSICGINCICGING